MKKTYKTMTDREFSALSHVIDRTKNDCWAVVKQYKNGTDYIYDWDEKKRLCLKTGVSIIADAIDCQENYDNCCLDWTERVALKQLFDKLGIIHDLNIDFRIPQFIGMPLQDFLLLVSGVGITAQQDEDDFVVDENTYRFNQYGICYSVEPAAK